MNAEYTGARWKPWPKLPCGKQRSGQLVDGGHLGDGATADSHEPRHKDVRASGRHDAVSHDQRVSHLTPSFLGAHIRHALVASSPPCCLAPSAGSAPTNALGWSGGQEGRGGRTIQGNAAGKANQKMSLSCATTKLAREPTRLKPTIAQPRNTEDCRRFSFLLGGQMLSESSQSEKLTQTSVIKWTGAPARATSAVESGGAAVTPAGAAAQPAGAAAQPAGAAAQPAGAAVTNVPGTTLAQRRRRHTPTLRPGAAPLPDPALAGLCAVPDPAPPFDDDVPGDATLHPNATISSIATSSPAATLQSDTALSRDSDTALSRAPNARASTVASSAAGPTQDQPTGHASPRAATWPSQFAQVLAETLAGSRPSRQLNPWTTERARGHIRRLGPLLAANREPRVRRIVACTPSSGVVEMAVVVCFGARVRALAVRLERDGITAASPAWRCTAIEAA